MSLNINAEEFSTHMEHLLLSPHYLMLTGDFNIHMDLLNVSENSLQTECAKQNRRLLANLMTCYQALA